MRRERHVIMLYHSQRLIFFICFNIVYTLFESVGTSESVHDLFDILSRSPCLRMIAFLPQLAFHVCFDVSVIVIHSLHRFIPFISLHHFKLRLHISILASVQ